ncbi:hypothetical protein [uncultured Aquimonas sp.]|jgi:hypothetical protein|uniref:hypothetical protein n=1 Tax=uncultured Aquimonas sp. TaxID=385483 RepID=UPI00260387BA|nr:hypothetical protein [uncultured Aquimonas sp.]
MSQTTPNAALIEQARRALSAHDETAQVEFDAAGGALRVHSQLDQATVLKVLHAAALPVAAAAEPAERSDCCGGCCGG